MIYKSYEFYEFYKFYKSYMIYMIYKTYYFSKGLAQTRTGHWGSCGCSAFTSLCSLSLRSLCSLS